MADVEVKITNQLRYTGTGPVDVKFKPVRTVFDLPSPLKAYNGQTVTVLSDANGEVADYQFVNGAWVRKDSVIKIDGGSF